MQRMCLWAFSFFLILIAWTLNSFIPATKPPLVNYDETVYFNHEKLRVPSSKEEIIDIVKSVAMRGGRVRVLGSGHSWSGVAESQDVLVSLHKLTGVVRVNMERKEVTVMAGTTLRELNHQLERQGLAMSNLPSVSEQTVAGAIATATHGTGVAFGNLATMVTKLELVSGKGELLTVSAVDNVEVFKAAQVSVGMLGIVTEVTLQCVEAFHLEETLAIHPLSDCLEKLEEIARSAEHVKLWIELFSGTCITFQTRRTTEEPRDRPIVFIENLKLAVSEVFIYVTSWFPRAVPTFMKLLFLQDVVPPHNCVDISYRVFNIPHYFPVHNEAEVIVGISNCAAAIRELQRVVDDHHIPLNYLTETQTTGRMVWTQSSSDGCTRPVPYLQIRFVQGDDIWLSPNYQRDSCHITQTIYNPSKTTRLRYFSAFHNATRKFDGRFHWGKDFNLTPKEVGSLYPKFEDFMRVRTLLDPKGIFLNDLMTETFIV